jgi:RecJ-like exonuclease
LRDHDGRPQALGVNAHPLRVVFTGNQEHVMSDTNEAAPGDDAPAGTPGTGENVCPVCDGSGRVNGQPCSNCKGTGTVIEGIGGG